MIRSGRRRPCSYNADALTLQPGFRLGPYEIVGAIGAGGMGEVYRARDAKLNRDVAIKVLLQAVANDRNRAANADQGRAELVRRAEGARALEVVCVCG
jgi:serine/threonine protein kinase